MRFYTAMILMLLAACSGTSITITGETGAAVDPDQVAVYYSKLPDCEFEEIAIVQIPGEYFTRAKLIEAFRYRAASIGANAVQVLYVQRIGASEYLGQARALQCANVEDGLAGPGPSI